MPSSDRRSPRKTAVLWSIAVFVCVIVFVCRQTGNYQPAGGDTTGDETPALTGKETTAPSGIDALELMKVVYIPYRPPFRFSGYVVPRNGKQPAVTMLDFLTVDRGLVKSSRLPVGADIPGTKFKTDSFEHKEVTGADGKAKDVSEVTVINKETGEKVVLPLNKRPDDSYAIFRYKWVLAGGQHTPDFAKRLDEHFTLPPKHDTTYKVIAITDQEVVIEVPNGTRITLTKRK